MTREEFEGIGWDGAYELYLVFYEHACLTGKPPPKATSANSSLSPGQDPFKAKRDNNSREKTGRRAGGQPGHIGSTLLASDSPDVIVNLPPPQMCTCGCLFTDADPVIGTEEHQVFDLPEQPRLKVTAYVAATKRCRQCHARVQAAFPADATTHVQYGFEIQNLIVYLRVYQLIPNLRTAQLLSDLYGIALSVGTIDNILTKVADKSESTLAAIKQALIRSKVVHFDESGMKIKGEKGWIHVATTELFTLYHHHAFRGRDAMEDGGILPGFTGIAIHDFLSAYAYYSCRHGYCGAHLIRECQGIVDANDYAWAKKLKALLCEMNRAVIAAKAEGRDALHEELAAEFDARYDQLLAAGRDEMPPPAERQPGQKGRPKLGKARCLFNRFVDFKGDILRFLSDFDTPFTNNLAEQALRMPKLMQKISGSTRSKEGGERFCGLRSICATLRKQGRDLWDGLGDLVRGRQVELTLPGGDDDTAELRRS